MKKVNFTRIYSDEAGDTRFGEMPVPLEEKGEIGSLSAAYPVEALSFRTTEASYDYDFHPAPARQLSPGTRRSLFITLA